jgi:hypothetical protein
MKIFFAKLRRFIINNLPKSILDAYFDNKIANVVHKWHKDSCPSPPPHEIKQVIIREYGNTSGYKIFVETGTYYGDMIFAQLNWFKELYSIELSDYYYEKAVQRFRKYNNVHLIQGDSSKMLREVLKDISEPAIFWLDGHYSGGKTAIGNKECPIYDELNAIIDHGAYHHILLIDDARCFNGTNDYPTIEAISRFLSQRGVDFSIDIKYDIIRIIL